MATTTLTSNVPTLLQLPANKVREALANETYDTALHYLVELFRGNGWIVSLTEGAGKALLLSEPGQPHLVLLVVKLVTQQYPLTYAQAREALSDFEERLAPACKCTQFAIVTLHGIHPKAERLEQFNLLLQDWTYVEELVANYRTKKIKEPRIQLFAHNKQTYKKVGKLMQHTTSVAVVQATGTGKSFLIAKLLQDFAGKRRLVMAPSLFIINQVKEHIRWDAGNIEFMTYARSMNLSQSEIALLNPGLIVLDEYHRCGAEEWGRGVQNILNAYPEAFKFGTSATPVRYMDNERDMSQELFGNNVAENLSLAQAIVRNILPMPKYVCALYSLREEVEDLKEKISKSRASDANKQSMLLELDTVTINWELSNGVPAILKKHVDKSMKKFIIFCKDEAHLLEMEPIVTSWFMTATGKKNITVYRIYNNETQSHANLEAFKQADSSKGLHLLLSINMLNEGLHVKDVSGVVLLRPTLSPNIFYQQIGRCLKVGLNHTPVIFDLVNNFRSIRTRDFLYDLAFAQHEYAAERRSENLKDNSPVFTLIDEVREIVDVFGEIRFRIDDWDAMYDRLVKYKERFGTCAVTAARGDTEHKPLWHWLHHQRLKYKKGLLEQERTEKLVALGVDWQLHQLTGPREEGWEQGFVHLAEFREKFGHCNVGAMHKEHKKLLGFVKDQRYRFSIGTLEQYRIDKLLAIGFEFERNYREGKWQAWFDKLSAYKEDNGHMNVLHKEDEGLAKWIATQRREFRKNKLDKGRQQKLISIGFEWKESANEVVDRRVAEMIAWYKTHGHFTFPVNSTLSNFSRTLRGKYRDKKLPGHIMQRLQPYGFNFEIKEPNDQVRKEKLQQLRAFFKLHGHGNVFRSNENYEGLGEWLSGQRKQYKRGNLDATLIQEMTALGVDWNNKQNDLDNRWNRRYALLLAMYEKEGKFPLKQLRKNEALKNWCAMQRKKFKKGELANGQVNKLNAIEFIWDVFDTTFENNFEALLLFREKHGHCRVPQKFPETKSLNTWCGNIRKAYFGGWLPAEKKERLESIGFIWNIVDAQWQETYETLKTFVINNGWDKLYSQNKVLHQWVSKNRNNYKQGKISEERVMLLNKLGISWLPLDDKFLAMLREFKLYKEGHNSTRIPHADKAYKTLWNWTRTIRENYRQNIIPPAQLKQLQEVGFEFEIIRTKEN